MRGSTAGIEDNFIGTSRHYYSLLSVLDTLLTCFLIGPAVVGYWRGTWMLMDSYVFPEHHHRSGWVSLSIGICGHLLFTMCQRPLAKCFDPEAHRLTYYAASRVYTALFGFVCVNSWRGAWKVLDVHVGFGFESLLAMTVVSVLVLASMRTLRNISAPPFAVILDNPPGYFRVPTMFRVSADRETWLYVLDCLFSVLVVGTLVVFVWRGAWTILEIYLFPGAPEWSAFGSLALGYAIVFLTFSLQTPLKGVCGRLEGFWRVCVVDIYLFFSFCGTVNLWRGVWNLLNLYFLSDTPVISYWVTHIACLLLLILLNCSNSVLVRGVYIDAEEEGGKCVVFPCYYLRLIFQTKRREKLQQLQMEQQKRQLVAATRRKSDVEKGVTTYVPETNNHVTLIPSEVAELLT